MKSSAERRRRIQSDLVRIQLAGLLAGVVVLGFFLVLHLHAARQANVTLQYHSRAVALCGKIGSELAQIERIVSRQELDSNDATIEADELTPRRDRQSSRMRASMDLIAQSRRELEALENRFSGTAFANTNARLQRSALDLGEAGRTDSLTIRTHEIEALLVASQQLSMLHSIAESEQLRRTSEQTKTFTAIAALVGVALLLFVIFTSRQLHRSVQRVLAGRELAYETLDLQRERLEELLEQKTHLVLRLEATDSELRRSQEQLRELALRTRNRREDERSQVSREIRDRLGQMLTSLKLDLGWVASRLSNGPDDRACVERIESMSGLIDGSLSSLLQLASSLRPALLDDFGLVAAMEWQAREFTRRTACECRLNVEVPVLEGEPHRDTALFRIFQEALSEIARDASSQRIQVSLRTSDNQLEMNIACDGAGLSQAPVTERASLWLRGIQERTLELGGRLRSPEGGQVAGTRLSVLVPISVEASGAAPAS